MTKLLFKPLGMITSVLGGLLATRIFNALWKALGHDKHAPSSTEANRSWSEVLVSAALQGAVYGLIKAATDRGGAVGIKRATGTWPGEEGQG